MEMFLNNIIVGLSAAEHSKLLLKEILVYMRYLGEE
jgi:hypothetical protein